MTSKLIIESMILGGGGLKFDAYLTDMSQTFDSTWNTTNVFGRNDPIATFAGTTRSISLAFDVPAGDLSEAKLNLEKCGKLATYLYPGYNTTYAVDNKSQTKEKDSKKKKPPIVTGRYMSRPPLVKIQFANIISQDGQNKGLLGFISSLSFNPVIEAGMFTEGSKLYPNTISLSIGFTVLHQRELGFEIDEKGNTRRFGNKIPFK